MYSTQDSLIVTPERPPSSTRDVGEVAYLGLLRRILDEGSRRSDRTGTGTVSLFGAQLRFDLRAGFPLVTTKRVPFSSIVRELLWFLRGSTNIADLGCKIWDEWATPDGDLGPIYGHQWRSWGRPYHAAGPLARHGSDNDWRLSLDRLRSAESGLPSLKEATFVEPVGPHEPIGDARAAIRELLEIRTSGHRSIDQITDALETIKRTPDSRRIIVCAWNVSDVPQMRLPPCHLLFQFYVDDGHLDCQLYQRSADMALGVPFNIASYALLLSMFAAECDLVPRYFVHTFGDAHIYLNHIDGIRQQLERDPLTPPRLILARKPVLGQTFEDISLEGYQHHPAIRFDVSV